MPSTKYRKKDLIDIFNNYIVYYHESHGSKAMMIDDNLFKKNEKLLSENLDFLLNVLRECILSESEILIQEKTFIKYYNKSISRIPNSLLQNKTLEEIEKEVIKHYLIEEEYNQSKVAEILGISRSTLWRKMKKYEF